MPLAVSPNPRAGSEEPNNVDRLLDFDNAVEDFMKDIPLNDVTQNKASAVQEPAKDIDEEITVKKKRKPNPKLDEARLLSDAGIPRLRKITKTQLKFRGKGHEFSDISRLLNTYQLWLDDLFPRAKFKDGLIDIEKIGHTKRMQVTRRAWLDGTKARHRDASPEREDDVVMSGALPETESGAERENGAESDDDVIFGKSVQPDQPRNDLPGNEQPNDGPDDDELDALLAETGNTASKPKGPFEEDSEDEDALDALLAEQTSSGGTASAAQSNKGATKRGEVFGDDFADEEEAMASMDMW